MAWDYVLMGFGLRVWLQGLGLGLAESYFKPHTEPAGTCKAKLFFVAEVDTSLGSHVVQFDYQHLSFCCPLFTLEHDKLTTFCNWRGANHHSKFLHHRYEFVLYLRLALSASEVFRRSRQIIREHVVQSLVFGGFTRRGSSILLP